MNKPKEVIDTYSTNNWHKVNFKFKDLRIWAYRRENRNKITLCVDIDSILCPRQQLYVSVVGRKIKSVRFELRAFSEALDINEELIKRNKYNKLYLDLQNQLYVKKIFNNYYLDLERKNAYVNFLKSIIKEVLNVC